MRRSGSHLGLVRDGDRVLGLVALEDVLEQLIGDVRGTDASGPVTGAQAGAGAGGR
jgi:CBS domain containing-hemolysin-like protein